MALGTDNVQSTQFAHACHVFHVLEKVLHVLCVEGIIFRCKRFQCRKTFFHAHIVWVRHAGIRKDAVDLRKGLLGQLAAQFDVHPAACHVGGNGHRAKGTRPGNDQRFFGMLAGIQHLVRDAGIQDRYKAGQILFTQLQDLQQ